MRALVLIIALTACTPAPPAAEQPVAQTAPNATILDAAPAAEGRWSFRGDEGVTSACFGAPDSECQLSLQCEAPTGTLALIVDAEITPDQDAAIQIYDDQDALTLSARSHNEGLPSVVAEIGPDSLDRAGLIATLSRAPQRFAVEARPLDTAGQPTRYVWDDSLTRVLNACR